MAACEKCWSDAHRGSQFSVADEYLRLMKERKDSPCTPEQQAGPDALRCMPCDRLTLHQHARVCMVCGWRPHVQRGHE